MNGEFVAAMEDMLDLYSEPYDHSLPVVCFNEASTSASGGLSDVIEPLPAQQGRPRRQDYKHRRRGTRNLFPFGEPLAGWRVRFLTNHAITERRTPHHSGLWPSDIEFSALGSACLKGRTPDADAMQRAIMACEARPNAVRIPINWHFRTNDARIKLHRFYPCLSNVD